MKKLALLFVALLVVFGFGRTAMAACTDITIGADIVVYQLYVDNKDFNDNTDDALSYWTEKVRIYLFNTYTDNVKTSMRIEAYTHDATKPSLEIHSAYIEMTEFLHPSVSLTVGKLDFTWQWRKTFGSGAFYQLVNKDMQSAFIVACQPLGWMASYKFSPDIQISFGWAKGKEGSVIGNNDNDIDCMFARYDQNLGENNKLFVALLYYVDRYEPTVGTWTMNGDIWYLDFGLDYFIMEESLELYLEFAYQGGDPHAASMDFGAFAFDLGAEYTFAEIETVPYVGIEITWYQGMDGNTYGFQRVNPNFNRTLIAESDYLGRIWSRDGYVGVKLTAGMKSIDNDKFGVDFILGYFKSDGDLPAGMDKGLGWEIDIVAAYYYTEDVTFSIGFGYFDPNEDLAGPNPDPTILLIWGVNIVF